MTLRFVILLLAGPVLTGCAEGEAPDDETNPARSPEISRIVPAEEALAGAHIPRVDPAAMKDAEIGKVLGPVAHCEFRYTSAGRPVLAVKNSASPIGGVVKLNGSLIQLQLANEGSGVSEDTITMTAGPVRARLTPLAPRQLDGRVSKPREMTLVFEIDTRRKIGYRGYFNCLAGSGATGKQVKNTTD